MVRTLFWLGLKKVNGAKNYEEEFGQNYDSYLPGESSDNGTASAPTATPSPTPTPTPILNEKLCEKLTGQSWKMEYVSSTNRGYGEPKEIVESSYWEESISKEYIFEKNSFGFVCYGDEGDSYLYFAHLADNLIRAPRDIQIGMALTDLLALFPNKQDNERHLLEGYAENEVAEYQVLYGEYMYMEQYAILIYQKDKVVEVEYADQGGVMRLHIKEDKVVSIEYMISLM